MADPKLLGIELKGVSRETMRQVLDNHNIQEMGRSRFADVYSASKLIPQGYLLELGYTSDGKFASAQYSITTDNIDQLVKPVEAKYGKPNKVIDTRLDNIRRWNLDNNMTISIYRSIPDTGIHMLIKDDQNIQKFNQEIQAAKTAEAEKEEEDRINSAIHRNEAF